MGDAALVVAVERVLDRIMPDRVTARAEAERARREALRAELVQVREGLGRFVAKQRPKIEKAAATVAAAEAALREREAELRALRQAESAERLHADLAIRRAEAELLRGSHAALERMRDRLEAELRAVGGAVRSHRDDAERDAVHSTAPSVRRRVAGLLAIRRDLDLLALEVDPASAFAERLAAVPEATLETFTVAGFRAAMGAA